MRLTSEDSSPKPYHLLYLLKLQNEIWEDITKFKYLPYPMATLKTHGFFLFSLVDGTVQGSLRGATGVQVSSRSDKGDVNGL